MRAPLQEVERDADQLTVATEALLRARGVPPGDAKVTADVMVDGTRRGFPHHGVERVLQVLEGLDSGALRARPERRVVRDGPAFAVLDADRGLGPPAGLEMVDLACAKARAVGVGAVGVLSAGHLGALSCYAEVGSVQGFMTIVTTTTSPAAVVPGGNVPLLGTNPLAYAFPVGDGGVAVADFSTTTVSRGTLLHHRETGKPLLPNWAVDATGRPTTDPASATGLLPHGGDIKGALVSLLLATLAGPLIGGQPNYAVTGTRTMDRPPTKGDLVLCFDIERFSALATFARDSVSQLHAMERSTPGFRTPGSRSHELRRQPTVTISTALDDLLRPFWPPHGAK